ncbi:MAG: MFS transporter [Thermoleophilia bacterium]|nr:MFS transporter [Thermoleophilia bacterium]
MDARARTIVFWSASALIGAETLLFGLLVPALPEFSDKLGLSDPQAAIIFALFPVGQLAASIVGAAALERVGRRPAMIASVVLMAAATVGFAFSDTVAIFALTRLLQGVAAGLAWTAGLAAISDVFPANQLGYRMSLAESVGGAGGGLAGPAVGGIAIDLIGVTQTFLFAAIVPVLLAVPVIFTPETRRARAGEPTSRWLALRKILAKPRAQVGTAALLVFAVTLGLLEPLLPLDIDRRLGLSATVIGMLFATLILADLIAAPIAGRWSDKRGRIGPMLVGGALIAVALPLTAIGPRPMLFTAMVVLGVGLGAMGAGIGALMTEAADAAGLAGQYGLSAGVITGLFALGALAGPVLGGLARTTLTYSATVTLLAAAVVAATIWMTSALRTVERQRE